MLRDGYFNSRSSGADENQRREKQLTGLRTVAMGGGKSKAAWDKSVYRKSSMELASGDGAQAGNTSASPLPGEVRTGHIRTLHGGQKGRWRHRPRSDSPGSKPCGCSLQKGCWRPSCREAHVRCKTSTKVLGTSRERTVLLPSPQLWVSMETLKEM